MKLKRKLEGEERNITEKQNSYIQIKKK